MVRGKKQKPSGLNSVTRACNVAYYCESLGFIFNVLVCFIQVSHTLPVILTATISLVAVWMTRK